MDVIAYAGHVPEADAFNVAWGPEGNSSDFPLIEKIVERALLDSEASLYIRRAAKLPHGFVEVTSLHRIGCKAFLHFSILRRG